jgi:hypothetical protein
LIIYYVDFMYNCICYDVCNSTDILCIILWLSPYPWDSPVKRYMEVNKNWNLKHNIQPQSGILTHCGICGIHSMCSGLTRHCDCLQVLLALYVRIWSLKHTFCNSQTKKNLNTDQINYRASLRKFRTWTYMVSIIFQTLYPWSK